MKQKYFTYFILTIIIMLSFISKTSAETCSTEDLERLKTIAEHVDLSYEVAEYTPYDGDEYVNEDNKKYIYKITIYNITNDFYIQSNKSYMLLAKTENTIVVNNVEGGKINIELYSKACSSKIRTISIELPYYNRMSQKDICKEYKEKIDECKEWTNKDIKDISTVEDAIKKYNEISQKEKKDKKKWNYQELLPIGVAIIAIIAIIILSIIIKKRSEIL